MYQEIIYVCLDIETQRINAFCGQNVEIRVLKRVVTH